LKLSNSSKVHLSFLSGCIQFFNMFSISSFYSILNSLMN
jgi:hypothetical protein